MAYQLTKLDIAAIRGCDDFCVSLSDGTSKVYATKNVKKTVANPFATDVTYSLDSVPVHVSNGDGVGVQAWCHVSQWSSVNHARSVLAQLRAGDEPIFIFHPDYHTTQNLGRAGLHGDVLLLRIIRNGKPIAEFELHASTCPDNTARMVRGVPTPRWIMGEVA